MKIKKQWLFIILMLLAFVVMSYGIVQQSKKLGFYEGCQSIDLDMVYIDGGYICGNLTAINMGIGVKNQPFLGVN